MSGKFKRSVFAMYGKSLSEKPSFKEHLLNCPKLDEDLLELCSGSEGSAVRSEGKKVCLEGETQ